MGAPFRWARQSAEGTRVFRCPRPLDGGDRRQRWDGPPERQTVLALVRSQGAGRGRDGANGVITRPWDAIESL